MKIKNIKMPSNKNFGIVFFVVFLFFGLYALIINDKFNILLFLVSIIFLILGLLNSKILQPLNWIWFKFGLFLGAIISPLIMAIIFFMIVTPMGIIMRIINKDILNLKYNNKSTYWIKKKPLMSSMKDQF